MKVLLASNASHVPPRGGSTRSNLVWLRHLATHGHECRVVAAAAEKTTPEERARFEAELRGQSLEGGAETVSPEGIRFFNVDAPAARPLVLRAQIETWNPDWVLVSSEDLSHGLLREAFRSAPGKVVYLGHTPQFFPFGTESWNQDETATKLLRGAAGIVTISHSVAAHVEKFVGVKSKVIHPPMYGAAPWPFYQNWGKGTVTMINPCAVKGISVFADLARAFPAVPFTGLRGWGTTGEDEALLRAIPNVTLRDAVKDIDEVLRETQILLMPSLWYEGFGLIVMEAMLRGIPVIASDYGGLSESTLGVSYLAPVSPIIKYEDRFDERHMPVPVVRPQNGAVWNLWLSTLLENQDTYQKVSGDSRKAAVQFVNHLDAGELQRWLESLQPAAAVPVKPAVSLEALTPEKRALLLRKLKKTGQ